jgi:O-succinylbenzoic acid--CoA ligase
MILVLMKELGKFERPKKIYFVEKFEETETGKINRNRTVSAQMV